MVQEQETAYPRLKQTLTANELERVYTPTGAQLRLARHVTNGPVAHIGFLTLLITFQRLGYFISIADVPERLIQHLARCAQVAVSRADLRGYDASGTRRRHLRVIRAHRQVQPFDRAARRVLLRALFEAARTKVELADLINIGIEELVRGRYELPTFNTLRRAVHHARVFVHRGFYRLVFSRFSTADVEQLQALLLSADDEPFTPWHQLKEDTGGPTLTHLKELLDRLQWLTKLPDVRTVLADIPDVKIKHFAEEAATLNAARMLEVESYKRTTLLATLLSVQSARVRDDIAELFIKRMLTIHEKARESLDKYQREHQARTDALIATLRDVVVAYQHEEQSERTAAIDAVLRGRTDTLRADCDAHLAHAGRNYYPFLWKHYISHRPTLFRILETLTFHSTSQNTAFIDALQFLVQHRSRTSEWLDVQRLEAVGTGSRWVPLLNLDWVPEGWWRLLTDQYLPTPPPKRIRRQMFEVCVFTELFAQLKSGDVALVGSDAYADYRDQLISWTEYHHTVAAYGQMLGFPTDGDAFVAAMQQRLHAQAQATDSSFPDNEALQIEKGEPILAKSAKTPEPPGLRALEAHIAGALPSWSVLDSLRLTNHWLNWTIPFGPVSGHSGKLKDEQRHYLATVFCYGCNLGPTQTARSLTGLDRKQLAWANQRHITEAMLEQASRTVINAYARLPLTQQWGSGKRASADGMKWEMYERNLLAEYHIRYGGYGGIGYYHVSDTYIALFSHFIPCGVWEAVYILDGLLKNDSDLQPDTIHADTQGQNAPVFALAYLLGITLMPRIRNWKHLTFFRPDRNTRYTHIDELFSDPVDWALIKTHLPDMLRVVLSIKAGRITASTILHRLSTYNRHNRLYQAFRAFGRVVRTTFLLQYLADSELRATIQAATNKSEAFNNFVRWLSFGGEGVISTNDRLAQRKIIKYNQLVANCVIFHNAVAISRLLHELHQAGEVVETAAVGAISPYITAHINRFGRYRLNMRQKVPELSETVFRTDWLVTQAGVATQGDEQDINAEHQDATQQATTQLMLDGL